MTKVSFVGAGRIGSAINHNLVEGVEVQMWDKVEGKVPNQQPLEEVVKGADILFLCVPSWTLQEAASLILPYLDKQTIVLCVTKGVERASNQTADEILQEVFAKDQPLGMLSGPMLADELEADLKGAATMAIADRAHFAKARQIFRGLLLEYSADLHGVALCGVLKNIFALGLGMAHGLEWGSNMKGWLVSESIQEFAGILEELGGKRETALKQAGMGDFIATGFSPYSKNHQTGVELAREGCSAIESEGAVSVASIVALLSENKAKEFRILQTLAEIITKCHGVDKEGSQKLPAKLFDSLTNP